MACDSPWERAFNGGAKRWLACQKCEGCKEDYARSWSIRLMHERQMHDFASFVTLTYENDPVSLRPHDLKLFLRRVRHYFGYCRYFACGEYGEKSLRPHFHAILYGFEWSDKQVSGKSGANVLYSSATLEQLWPFGISAIGDVTVGSCLYVARYSLKGLDQEIPNGLEKPFIRMSRMPGIGSRWLDAYGRCDVLADGKVLVNGQKVAAPRAYGKKLRARFPFAWRAVQESRLERMAERALVDNSNDRLADKAAVRRARRNLKKGRMDHA